MHDITTHQVTRADVFTLLARARVAVCSDDALAELLSDWHIDGPPSVAAVTAALAGCYGGVTPGHLSELYEALTGERVEVVGEPQPHFACPCCHRETLTERWDLGEGTGYDICRFCGWEDDGTVDPGAHSGVNRGSMGEYRARVVALPDVFVRDRWRSSRR